VTWDTDDGQAQDAHARRLHRPRHPRNALADTTSARGWSSSMSRMTVNAGTPTDTYTSEVSVESVRQHDPFEPSRTEDAH
jgi:hypothetical protein